MRTKEELITASQQGKGPFQVTPAEWTLLVNERLVDFDELTREGFINNRPVHVVR